MVVCWVGFMLAAAKPLTRGRRPSCRWCVFVEGRPATDRRRCRRQGHKLSVCCVLFRVLHCHRKERPLHCRLAWHTRRACPTIRACHVTCAIQLQRRMNAPLLCSCSRLVFPSSISAAFFSPPKQKEEKKKTLYLLPPRPSHSSAPTLVHPRSTNR